MYEWIRFLRHVSVFTLITSVIPRRATLRSYVYTCLRVVVYGLEYYYSFYEVRSSSSCNAFIDQREWMFTKQFKLITNVMKLECIAEINLFYDVV